MTVVEKQKLEQKIALLLGYDGKSSTQVVNIEGTAEVTKDDSLRSKLWNEELKQWFKGPEDPDYVILEITPSQIQYSDGDHKQEIWKK